MVLLHAGPGVKTPPVPKKPRRIVTGEQYDAIYANLNDETMRLLVETDIESGLRWGELTELRPKDLDAMTRMLTVSRAVVELKSSDRPGGQRFVVKDYPKDREWRQLKLPSYLVEQLTARITALGLADDDLLFPLPRSSDAARSRRPAHLPDPETLGLTEPNLKGRR